MKHLINRALLCFGYRIVRYQPEATAQPGIATTIPQAELTGTSLNVTDSQFKAVMPLVEANKTELLKIPAVRGFLATERHKILASARAVAYASFDEDNVIDNTVPYNKGALNHYVAMDRLSFLLGVVKSITKVARNLSEQKILLVGPRTEIEIFVAQAGGFDPQNISALDLFSYSPLITAGDMHAMPFPDSSFDIVFVTCCMSYSKNAPKAVSEVVRVLKDGGYVAFIEPMHADFLPGANKDAPKPYDNALDLGSAPAFWGSVDDVLELFGHAVAEVPFRNDPSPPYDGWGLLLSTVFKIKK